MFLERGFEFTHEAVGDWEARFAPLRVDQLRAKRRGQAGWSCYVDEMSLCLRHMGKERDGDVQGKGGNN